MTKGRKTVDIGPLLEYANGYLASDYIYADGPESIARRKGMIDLLEAALFSANRYRGFSYLDETQITKSKPGIRWNEGRGLRFENTDDTRRRYA